MADDLKISLGLDTSGFKTGLQEAKAEVANSSKQMASSLQSVPDAANSAAEDIKKAMGLDFATPLKEAMDLAKQEVAGAAKDMQSNLQAVPDTASDAATSMVASFGVVGLAIGGVALAVVGLEKGLTALADRATDIARSAALVRATAEEWQGMAAAAGGVGVQSSSLVTALSGLIKKLDEARQGSSTAIVELTRLGLTLDQINDPTLTTLQLWNLLRERLLDGGTSAKTAAELVKQLAGAGYDLSLAMKQSGDSMGAWNKLSKEQIGQLQQLGHWWGNLYSSIKNVASKGALGYFGQFMSAPPAAGKSGDQATGAAQTATPEELAAIKASVAAFKEGSQEKVDILTRYYQLALAAEGQYSTTVIEAEKQLLEAQRQLAAARERIQAESLKRQEAEQTRSDRLKEASAREQIQFAKEIEKGFGDAVVRAEKEMETSAVHSLMEFTRIEQDRVNTGIQLSLLELQAKRDAIQAASQLGQISASEAVRREQEVEDERYQIVSAGLAERMQLADGDRVTQNKLRDDQLVAEKQHQLALGQLRQDAIEAQRAPAIKMVNDLASQWRGGLVQMMQGQLSFANAIRGMWAGIKASILNALAESILANLKMAAISAITGKKQILSDAAQSAAGAYKATVGIPFIGPVLAPIAAAGAFAAVSAFGRFTAAEGFDIPANLNPVTQLHAREMVLPAHIADPLRNMLASGGGGDTHNHYHIHGAIDGASVRRFFLGNQDHLAEALRRAHQGGHFAKF